MAALSERGAGGRHVGWVLIGERPYSAQDVADAYEFPVVAVLPDDSRAATALIAGADPARLRRSQLLREVQRLAHALADWLGAVDADRSADTDRTDVSDAAEPVDEPAARPSAAAFEVRPR